MLSFKSYFRNPKNVMIAIMQHFGWWIPDKTYIKWMYRIKMGKRLHLNSPQTFNEKLQWLKLFNRRAEYTVMVDKYAVKDYVANIIGRNYIIPTLGVWDKPEDICWESLPDRFVLKTTHGGGNTGVVICRDKSSFDRQKAMEKLNKSLKQDIYRTLREWPYKNVPKRIIAEQYLGTSSDEKDLPDYKFFCFDGEVKALFVGTERGTGDVKFDFFDSNWNHLDLVQAHPMSGRQIPKPQCLEEMKQIASQLSKGLPHVRIDLYECDGNVYFGEITFYHHGGIVPFHPEKWDYEFGKWIKLPCDGS